MKRLALSFFVFSIWAALASTYYACIIQGLCTTDTITAIPTDELQKNTTQPTILTKANTTPLLNKTDTITNQFAAAEDTLDSITRNTTFPQKSKDTLKPSQFSVYYKGELVIYFPSNFRIYENSDRIQIPFDMSTYGHAIAKEMDTKNLLLNITGYHNKNEAVEIGKDRAMGMADRLIKLGIHDSLITTKTQIASFDYNKNGKFKGGITFDFKASELPVNLKHIGYNAVEIPTIEKIEFQNTPITYPNTTELSKNTITEKTLLKNPTLVVKEEITVPKETINNPASYTVTQLNFKNAKFKGSRGLKSFLLHHTSVKKIQLIGYTNENESPDENYQAGLALATSVQSYVLKKGLSNASMHITALKTQKKGTPLDFGVTLLIE
ncbi:outer membrane protein [Aquimarina agarilytica]|uniref:outer membrane protein n=1 Tax=Aquimarina agarilytica TaxID=1087449 RepID=UPI000289CC81|nr:outer membrane protein [Aquimarina agarilytica]